MAIQPIDPRIYSRDTDKDSFEVTFKKINDNFIELDGRSGGTLDADDIAETSTRFWLTNVLKTAYDGAVSWISTNGTNILNHLASTSNPHSTTASQVGAYTTSEVNSLLSSKANKSTTPIILKTNFLPNTITAPITTETIVDNYDLGVGFLAVGESLSLYAELVKNVAVSGTSQTFIYLSKVSNSISVTDAVKIATSVALGSGGGTNYVERTFYRKSSAILSGRVLGTTAQLTDKASVNNIPQNIINDANLSNYRYLIVSSTYTGTASPNTMQTNIILTKNPIV